MPNVEIVEVSEYSTDAELNRGSGRDKDEDMPDSVFDEQKEKKRKMQKKLWLLLSCGNFAKKKK